MAFAFVWMSTVLTACGPRELSGEDKALVAELKQQVSSIQLEIKDAEQMAGRGLIGALAGLRLEALRSTEALLNQRIAAIEVGAPLKFEEPVRATKPDPKRAAELEMEIAKQEKSVDEAERRAGGSGGLVGAFSAVTVETERQSLATLRMQYLSAKYGLPSLGLNVQEPERSASDVRTSGPRPEDSILTVRLLRKRLGKSGYEDFVTTDLEFKATGLDKPARAIKGVLTFRDLFGEEKLNLGWTIEDPIEPGQLFVTSGSGFEYNEFKDDHQWVASTAVKDITTTYQVTNIIYADGTRRDFDE
jgi:hypothetical protein